MKIVLSWVFDHLNASVSDFDPHHILTSLTQKTVEIESMETITRNIDDFACAQIIEEQQDEYIIVDHLSRHGIIKKTEITQERCAGNTYLINLDHETKEWQFCNMKDLGGERDFLLPPFYIKESNNINLHQLIPASEIVFTIDNNAISHRPDLWCHRGFARELSAIFNISLKPLETLVSTKKLISHVDSAPTSADFPFSITLENKSACDRFAGLFVSQIASYPSVFDMAARLCLVDCKPIDFLVDATNVVLFDIGQPMHIYDAEILSEKRIVVRNADENSTLTLLDGQTITLTKDDLIIADGLNPISLAGIMGGQHAKVTKKTSALFVESAHFDALTIRKSSTKFHKKTESSMRFSKNIDPNQNVFGITRYIALLEQYKIPHKTANAIESLGNLAVSNKITISHDFIEKKLGISLEGAKIRQILISLGFDVQIQGTVYSVVIGTHRSDLTQPEDIVEEIARMVGYDAITHNLPYIITTPKKCTETMKQKREIKNLLSFGFLMREIYTYALFDESFLKKINYNPHKTVFLKNPISSDKIRLVSTLLVNLIKTVEEQQHNQDRLRFYEMARVWQEKESSEIHEQEILGGIFFEKKEPIDFYQEKQFLDRLFSLLHLKISYKTITTELPEFELYDPTHSALILHNDEIIGHCGIINPALKNLFDKGNVFLFECSAKILEHQEIIRYREISPFPAVQRDLSVLLSLQETTEDLISYFYSCGAKIRLVYVVDIFQKKEWENKRAVTFRFIIEDHEKTLTSQEIDTLFNRITNHLTQKGIEIR